MEKGEKNMIFEFSNMEDTVIPNFYGGEKHNCQILSFQPKVTAGK